MVLRDKSSTGTARVDTSPQPPQRKQQHRKAPKRKKNSQELTRPGIARALEMHQSGMVPAEIARACGVTRPIITKVLSQFEDVLTCTPQVPEYVQRKSELLHAAEIAALKSTVTLLDNPRTTARDAAYAFREIFHAGRLTRNESTVNNASTLLFVTPELPARR